MEPATLRHHVRFFVRRKVRFITAKDLFSTWPEQSVWFTFDDAYEAALTHAAPILSEFDATATFYAVPNLVGGVSSWDPKHLRALANWHQLCEAHASGFEIGNHTDNHPDLAELDLDQQVAAWDSAIRGFREHGIAPVSACYPYGRTNAASAAAAAQAGYSVGVGLGKRLARESDGRLALPRIVVSYSDQLPKLLYKMYLRPLMR